MLLGRLSELGQWKQLRREHDRMMWNAIASLTLEKNTLPPTGRGCVWRRESMKMNETLPPSANLACNEHCPEPSWKYLRFQEVKHDYLWCYILILACNRQVWKLPCILINWPSFNAAPRIWVNFDTRRLILPSVIINEDDAWSSEDVERRMSSEAAP